MKNWLQSAVALAAGVVLLLASAARGADDPAIRIEINRVLDAMASACVAGDAEAYLQHVDASDSEFRYEQKYFANDARREPPEACTFSVDEEGFTVGEGTAEGTFKIAWNMPGKKPREVSFKARFVNDNGAWKYAGETWERLEAPAGKGKVLVMFDPGLDEVAAKTIEAFASVREKVEEGFELAGDDIQTRTQKIKLYGTMKHLQASICLAYEDGLSGWNEPNESIKLLTGRNSTASGLKRLLAHEFGHVATFELGPKANTMPWWVLEGVAEVATEMVGGSSDRLLRSMRRLAKEDKLAPFAEMADFHVVPDKYRGLVYSQGQAMVGYISEQFGRSGRNKWLRAMSEGKTVDEATVFAFERPFADLDAQWRETLKQPLPDDAEPAPKTEGKPAQPDSKATPEPKVPATTGPG